MTMRERLAEYAQLEIEIRARQEELLRTAELAGRLTAPLRAVPGAATPDEHGREKLMIAVADMREEIRRDVDRLLESRRALEELIRRLPGGRERNVLFARYVLGKPIREIAAEMELSESFVYKLHAGAVRGLERSAEP